MTTNTTQTNKAPSGIIGYVHTQTSITIKFANGNAYRYDLSTVLDKTKLNEMIKLAKSGSGLNSFLNKNPEIRKYGYLDNTLTQKSSFTTY